MPSGDLESLLRNIQFWQMKNSRMHRSPIICCNSKIPPNLDANEILPNLGQDCEEGAPRWNCAFAVLDGT
jgi:hypothetical protein